MAKRTLMKRGRALLTVGVGLGAMGSAACGSQEVHGVQACSEYCPIDAGAVDAGSTNCVPCSHGAVAYPTDAGADAGVVGFVVNPDGGSADGGQISGSLAFLPDGGDDAGR